MLSWKSTSFRVFLLMACALGIVVFKSSGRGRTGQNGPERASSKESPKPPNDGDVTRLSAPAKPAPRKHSNVADPAVFEAASATNLQLQTELAWNFGGKLQRGWDLYSPLIAHLIGAGEASRNEFAASLSRWQKENNLDPTGVLDSETWAQMVSTFQSRRAARGRQNLDPNQLVTIPVSDCYDTTRTEELRRVESATFAAYKRMVAAAAADSSLGLRVDGAGQLSSDEKFLKIYYAYSSREYQQRLRQQSPNSGRAGLAINSPHFTGRALDIYVGGEPVSTKDDNRALQTRTPVYRWLVKNAARFGFHPYFYEPWHWEYTGVPTERR